MSRYLGKPHVVSKTKETMQSSKNASLPLISSQKYASSYELIRDSIAAEGDILDSRVIWPVKANIL